MKPPPARNASTSASASALEVSKCPWDVLATKCLQHPKRQSQHNGEMMSSHCLYSTWQHSTNGPWSGSGPYYGTTEALSKRNLATELCRAPISGSPIGYLALLYIYFIRSRRVLLIQKVSMDMTAMESCRQNKTNPLGW